MATAIWRGDQAAYYQVTTITASGTWAVSDTATLTINDKDLVVTVGSDVALADIAEILGRMVNGDAVLNDETRTTTGNLLGEWNGITATYSGAVLTLTADVAGTPFTVTASEVTASTGALGAPSTTTDPAGPNELAADNVSTGSLTPTSNTLAFEGSSVSCKYGLDQSAAGTWDELLIDSTYTGDIGLPFENAASPTNYAEYLDRYFQINATSVVIGEGDGSGSPRLLLDLGSVLSSVYVRKTSTSSDTGLHALRIKGTNASNTMYIDGGTVDIAPDSGDVATVATLNVSGSATVRTSPGVTLTTISVSGSANLVIDSDTSLTDITTITLRENATVTIYGDNDITNIYVYGGTLKPLGTFTIATLKVGAAGKVVTAGSTGAVTVTNCEIDAKANITDDSQKITFSNAIDLGLAGLEDVTLRLGKGIDVLPS